MITHEWLVSNGFKHSSLTKIELYTRDGMSYVHDEGEEFGLRIQNVIRQKSIKYILDIVNFHRILTGYKIDL